MKKICITIYLLGACSANVFAEGTSAGNTLVRSVGAKPQAMGEAYSAMPGDKGGVIALHYNPAALAFVRRPEFSLLLNRGIGEDHFGAVTFGLPLRLPQMPKYEGNFGASFLYYSAGEIELVDSLGNSRTVSAQKDYAAIFSFAKSLARAKISLGANAKILRSELVETFAATAFALDLGALVRFRLLALGLAVQNLGTQVKYNNSADSLPLTVRTGLSHKSQWDEDHQTLAAFEIEQRKGDNLKTNFGLEYLYLDTVAVRAGYKIGQRTGKLNLGAGFKVNRIQTDYSMQVIGESGIAYFVSVGYLFGQPEKSVEPELDLP